MNKDFPLSSGYAVSKSLPWSNGELTGVYINIPENGAYSDMCLFGTEGISDIVNTGAEEINRGAIVMADIPYFVNGTKLYRIDRTIDADTGVSTFSPVSLGTVSGSNRVSMATNGLQIVIVVPATTIAYVYVAATGAFTTITDADFVALGSDSVNYVDGYFVHNANTATNLDTFFHSELNDGTSYVATDIGAASVDPDRIKVGHVFNNKYYALGSKVIEAFDNVGGSGFVFQRREGFIIPKGVLANFSVRDYDGGFVFLGAGENEQPALWKLSGSTLDRLSTTTIQDQLEIFSDAEIAAAFTWISGTGGAYFLHLTVGNKTFSYDSTASRLSQKKIWHERSSFVAGAVLRNRVNSAVTAYGRVLVGDSISGRIGELDASVYTEYGLNILRSWSTQPLTELNEEMSIGTIELSIESGVGDLVTIDPQISLEINYDGRTYGNAIARSMGKQGEWHVRPIWDQNGMLTTQAGFRFTMSDPVKFVAKKLTIWVD